MAGSGIAAFSSLNASSLACFPLIFLLWRFDQCSSTQRFLQTRGFGQTRLLSNRKSRSIHKPSACILVQNSVPGKFAQSRNLSGVAIKKIWLERH